MAREHLAEAAELLEQAADAAEGDAAETLREQSRQLANLAAADHGPDHGRLARHQSKLRDVKATVDASVGSRIDEAYDHINAHRETLEGV